MFVRILDVTSVLELFAIFGFLIANLKVIQRRWFSPISDIPGPLFGSFSILWQIWHIFKGHTEAATIELHKKHGSIISTPPLVVADTLSR